MSLAVSVISGELRTDSRSTSRFAGRRVHFIGIGGCGMSGLARILLDAGATVSGSDAHPSAQTLLLQERGASISCRQDGSSLEPEIDLVVRTAAVPDTNPEFQRARALGIPHLKYAQMLGQVMAERRGVAISGTHGKSTTTAMIAFALQQCGVDPSFVVGGTVPQLGGGSHSGTGDAFVVEACEFDRSFHNLHPRIALITNIEEDHLDCYPGGIAEIIESFHHFAALVPADGLIIANGQDPNTRAALKGIAAPVQCTHLQKTGGKPDPAGWSTVTTEIENGCYCGNVHLDGRLVAHVRLSVAGEHNLINATQAIAACVACGVDAQQAADALAGFHGVDRRMTELGRFNGAVVVDDYGHHPTEIRATLKALREHYRPRRLFCVFQPHQHSRTRMLLDDFARSFSMADEALIPDIYFVRDSESEKQRVSALNLVAGIVANGGKARHLAQFPAIVEYLKTTVGPGDVVLTLGAGNIWEVARTLLQS